MPSIIPIAIELFYAQNVLCNAKMLLECSSN